MERELQAACISDQEARPDDGAGVKTGLERLRVQVAAAGEPGQQRRHAVKPRGAAGALRRRGPRHLWRAMLADSDPAKTPEHCAVGAGDTVPAGTEANETISFTTAAFYSSTCHSISVIATMPQCSRSASLDWQGLRDSACYRRGAGRHGRTRAYHVAVGVTQDSGAQYKRSRAGHHLQSLQTAACAATNPALLLPRSAGALQAGRGARQHRSCLLRHAARSVNSRGFPSRPCARAPRCGVHACCCGAQRHGPGPPRWKGGCSTLRTAGRTWPRRRFARTAARPRPSCCRAPCRAAAARGRSPGARAAWPARSPARPGTPPPCTARTSSPCPCLRRARGHHAEPEPGAKLHMSPL